MSSEPLDPSKADSGNGADAGNTRVLSIDNLHLHSNEIDALRRLAEADPELAKILVTQKDSFDRRDHWSYRFGVVMAAIMALGLTFSLSYVLINLGLLLSMVMIAAVVVLALMVRVLLTGEWSDTSAVSKIVDGIIHITGGKKKD